MKWEKLETLMWIKAEPDAEYNPRMVVDTGWLNSGDEDAYHCVKLAGSEHWGEVVAMELTLGGEYVSFEFKGKGRELGDTLSVPADEEFGLAVIKYTPEVEDLV